MDNKERKKPEQVLWLEEQLGFELREVKTEKEILNWLNGQSYLLNEKQELRALSLYGCNLANISFLLEFKDLILLNLGANQISDISILSTLKELTTLSLGANQISDISPLLDLKKLTYLDISVNSFLDIDIYLLPSLKNLTYLDFSANQILDYSPLSELENLTSLKLYDAHVSDYSFLLKLHNLTFLNIRDSQVSDISALASMNNLSVIDLSSNEISDISVLANLKKLSNLNLSYNKISDISFLSELKNLTDLSISSNNISDITVLGTLEKLIDLDISYLDINNDTIQNVFVKLKDLTHLRIVGNSFSDVSFLSKLEKISYLNLNDNQISDLSPLMKLKKLTDLELNINEITDISPLAELGNLKELEVSYNKIKDISCLADLKKITFLNLSNNKICSTKGLKEIVENESIEHLRLEDNPIPYLPQELIKEHCLPHLRNYYQNQDFVPNKEIKVVILGNGMVGKSTLLNRFLNPTGDWEKEIQIDISDRTEGIVIKENIPFDLEDDKEIRLNIWDFGGQEVYHGTHRLFLNKDAVYIIVWTLETDEQKEEIRQDLHYWLDYAQDLAIDSPIILVHSQCDKESEKDQDKIDEQIDILRDSKYKNSITTRYLKFSAKEKTGIKELNKAIKKAIKDKLSARVETEIPKKWSFLRDDLRELRKDTENKKDKINEISKKDYQAICDKYEISESEAETVLTFLHRTGFLYYDTQLSDNIILNQTWAIEAIYEALKPSGLVKDKNGKISSDRLKRLWQERGYSKKEAKTFIDFMLSSEICFCKEQQNYRELENPTFIVPHYLEEPANSFTRWRYENSFYMIYKPQFFHKGIAERFLSRLGRLSKETDLWRDGIRIFSDTFKGEALIIFDREKKEVNISTENYELLKAIEKELNKILDEGSQTKPSEKVTFFYSLDGEEFVEKKKLMTQIQDGNQFVRTVNNKKVEVKDFAEKYRLKEPQKTISEKPYFEENRKQAKNPLIEEANNKKNPIAMKQNLEINEEGKKKIKIFISYSSKDREIRELFVEELQTHLAHRKNFEYSQWTDTEIDLGADWEEEINKALKESNVAILLVSANFAASSFINEKELTAFFKKRKEEGYLILPVLITKYNFSQFEKLSKLNFFKTYNREYGFNKPIERNKLLHFAKLAENENTTNEQLSIYFNKLADFVDTSVSNTF